jgi:prepilin-type processing-associated H-X9-DG protein
VGCDANGLAGAGVGSWTPSVANHGIYQQFIKEADFAALSPSMLWVFVDEHPDSINDCGLGFAVPVNLQATEWVDVPADYHNFACGFSFADGHSEIHKWLDHRSHFAILDNGYLYNGNPPHIQPNNQDIWWMGQRTSARAY